MANQQSADKVKHPPYQDFAGCSYEEAQRILNQHTPPDKPRRPRGGAKVTFPMKLHSLLESIADKKSAISWQHHGRAFKIHDKERFSNEILPAFFSYDRQYSSFQRQLNIYVFLRISGGPDARAYYHPLFIRSRPELCDLMQRKLAEKKCVRRAMDPATEPDLCILPPMPQASPGGGGASSLLGEISYAVMSSRNSSGAGVASAKRDAEKGGYSCGDDDCGGTSSEAGAPAYEVIGRSNQPGGQTGVDEAFYSLVAAAGSPKRRKQDPNAYDSEGGPLGDGDTAGFVPGSMSEVFTEQPSHTKVPANLKDTNKAQNRDISTTEDHAFLPEFCEVSIEARSKTDMT